MMALHSPQDSLTTATSSLEPSRTLYADMHLKLAITWKEDSDGTVMVYQSSTKSTKYIKLKANRMYLS